MAATGSFPESVGGKVGWREEGDKSLHTTTLSHNTHLSRSSGLEGYLLRERTQ